MRTEAVRQNKPSVKICKDKMPRLDVQIYWADIDAAVLNRRFGDMDRHAVQHLRAHSRNRPPGRPFLCHHAADRRRPSRNPALPPALLQSGRLYGGDGRKRAVQPPKPLVQHSSHQASLTASARVRDQTCLRRLFIAATTPAASSFSSTLSSEATVGGVVGRPAKAAIRSSSSSITSARPAIAASKLMRSCSLRSCSMAPATAGKTALKTNL